MEAALFAFNSPLSKGATLADEVGGNLNPFLQDAIVCARTGSPSPKDAHVRQTPWDLVVVDEHTFGDLDSFRDR